MRKRIIKVLAFCLGLSLIAAGGVFASRYLVNQFDGAVWNSGIAESIPGAATKEGDNQQVNVLLMATDADGLLTDVMMIASFDKERKLLNVISIPRDTRVMINGIPQKLNAAYLLGKEGERQELTIQKINELIDLPIHYYACVNPRGFRNIVDILGGVEVDVKERMEYHDPAQNLHIDLYPGLQVLDGAKAEQFCRFRGYADADYERSKAQQQFLRALIDQKLKPEYLLKAGSIFKEISENLSTDIGIGDIMTFLPLLEIVTNENTNMYVMPGEDTTVNGIWYFIPDQEKTDALIRETFLNQAPKATVSPSASSVPTR